MKLRIYIKSKNRNRWRDELVIGTKLEKGSRILLLFTGQEVGTYLLFNYFFVNLLCVLLIQNYNGDYAQVPFSSSSFVVSQGKDFLHLHLRLLKYQRRKTNKKRSIY